MDDIMRRGPVIPVLSVDRPQDAEPLARALVAGGLAVIEVVLRTPAALEVIAAMNSVPGAVVGAGTVLSADQVRLAARAGARFIVTPGLTAATVEAARSEGLPILPGVATAGEVMRGLELGLDRFKFFPAEAAGGPKVLAAYAGPFQNVAFCPTGGVSAGNAAGYLALPNVICVGGSWLAPPDVLAAGDWPAVTAQARAALALAPSRA